MYAYGANRRAAMPWRLQLCGLRGQT
eukprot:SAG11_NODE_15583_length_573_cov_0.797468_2_plen_25_part_01